MSIEKNIRAAEAVLIPIITNALKNPNSEVAQKLQRLMDTKGIPCERLIYRPKPWRPQPRMIFNGFTMVEISPCYSGFVLVLWEGQTEDDEKQKQVLAMGWETERRYPFISPPELFLDLFWVDSIANTHFYDSSRKNLPGDLSKILHRLADPALVLPTLEKCAHQVSADKWCPF